MAWLHVMCLFASFLIAEDATQCDRGHYGESCELLCSPHCAVEPKLGGTVGDCDRVTGRCYEGCVRGWYGDHCRRPCSQTCKDNICNRDNGHCTLPCSEPHVGDFCTEVLNTDGSRECLKGRYGSDCLLPCPAQCWSNPHDTGGAAGRCERDTGVCGDECHRGWYGEHCNHTCSRNCKGNICNQGNGHCTLGCTGKYPGDVCTEVVDEGNNNSLTPIISSVIVAVLLVLVLVLVLVLRPRLLHYSRQKFCMAATEDTSPLLSQHEVDTDLIAACKEGKLDRVTDILDQSLEDINMKGHGGMTPVMWAARRGLREVLDLLVRKEADLKLVDDASNNILHWACYGSNFAVVKYVLSLGKVDINNTGPDGRTPAMLVARQGYMKLFELLVSKGGFPSEVDKDGNNILLLACWGGNEEIVKYIISHDDVDINGRGQSGRTPLMAAAYKGHRKVFDLLLDKEADLTLVDDAGDNVLHVACLGGHVDIVQRVLQLGKVDKNSLLFWTKTKTVSSGCLLFDPGKSIAVITAVLQPKQS